ncbi:MAG: prolyl oligopeptidase family serine peptidase [Pseudomonadota bacterium]
MSKHMFLRLASVGAVLFSGSACADSSEVIASVERFTVTDSIEMSYFGTIQESNPDYLADDGLLSPNGLWVTKVTHRGNVASGKTEATIWLFDVASITSLIDDERSLAVTPQKLATWSATVNGLPSNSLDRGLVLYDLQWSDDGNQIYFRGRDENESWRLYSVDVKNGSVMPRTPLNQNVLGYDTSGDQIIYLANDATSTRDEWNSASIHDEDIVLGNDMPLIPLLYPNFRAYEFADYVTAEVWRIDADNESPVLNAATNRPVIISTRYSALLIELSPDGESFVTLSRDFEELEPSTATLNNGHFGSHHDLSVWIGNTNGGDVTVHSRIRVNDLQWGRSGRIVVAWSPDSQSLVLSEVAIIASEDKPCLLVEIRVPESAIECLTVGGDAPRYPVYSVTWNQERSIHLTSKKFGQAEYEDSVLEKQGANWTLRELTREEQTNGVRLFVVESINVPPRLAASNFGSNELRVIFDPNPQLRNKAIGSAQIYTWTDSSGEQLTGGLLLPAEYDSDLQYPLVIQTHGFNPSRFLRIGYSETANAGRALAAQGFVVLQVQEAWMTNQDPWDYAKSKGVDSYVSAINSLEAAGLIDSERVGITGYSFSGWLVAHALVAEPSRFAAAVVSNTDPGTITGYFSHIHTPMAQNLANLIAGERPYGDGLQVWAERSPSLQARKIQAPVLVAVSDPWHLITLWEFYASLIDQGRPALLQYIRSGSHNLSKPIHRKAHQELIVSWFKYWLDCDIQSDHKNVENFEAAAKNQTALNGGICEASVH